MLEKSKNLSQIKKELKKYIEDKNVLDVILFGSFVKGKQNPSDIDIAIISEQEPIDLEDYHVSFIKPQEFFRKIPSLITTLFKEGYSLKTDQYFSEKYGFRNKTMFSYELSGISDSSKVKIVNFLRGAKKSKGIVEENGGEWLTSGVFFCQISNDYLFEQYFLNNKIKFKKYNLLIH